MPVVMLRSPSEVLLGFVLASVVHGEARKGRLFEMVVPGMDCPPSGNCSTFAIWGKLEFFGSILGFSNCCFVQVIGLF